MGYKEDFSHIDHVVFQVSQHYNLPLWVLFSLRFFKSGDVFTRDEVF